VTLAEALAHRPVVLDGGLATQLETRGHDLSSRLWSAQLLLEQPDEVSAAHQDFFAAGAEVAITSSYQVSYEGLAALGLDAAHTNQLLARSIKVARAAASGQQWVAASIGPYGAMLADGSEYRGDYRLSVAELREWHRPRWEALLSAEPDVLAIETIPCLAEAEAVLQLAVEYQAPIWLSLTVVGTQTRCGEDAEEAFAMTRGITPVIAVGANCSDATGLVEVVATAARVSQKPVVVYPNSGEGWDAQTRCWGKQSTFQVGSVLSWLKAGAKLVGGCCRVGPKEIHQIANIVNGVTTFRPKS
jgi:homocysteine S-methyltransferase